MGRLVLREGVGLDEVACLAEASSQIKQALGLGGKTDLQRNPGIGPEIGLDVGQVVKGGLDRVATSLGIVLPGQGVDGLVVAHMFGWRG